MPKKDNIEIAVKAMVTEWISNSSAMLGPTATGTKRMPRITAASDIYKLADGYCDSIDRIDLAMLVPMTIEAQISKHLGTKFKLSDEEDGKILWKVPECKYVRDLSRLVRQEVDKYTQNPCQPR